MIVYTVARSNEDIAGIRALQEKNLRSNLSQEEIISQGFVTIHHRPGDLEKLNAIENHVIAKEGSLVIAYLLAMTAQSRQDIPILFPIFEKLDKIEFKGKKISEYNFMLVGQVCVAKEFRGQSVLDNCYQTYRQQFGSRYDFAITEIATINTRSIKAHQRIGFQEVHQYFAPNGEEWSIVIWNWME